MTNRQQDENPDNPRILIADDDPVIRELLQSIVEDEGWRCETAVDGADAISKIERAVFDVVLTDLQMPRRDGIEVLRKVRELSAHTEVIILTGFTSESAAIQAVKLGAFDYLKKPLSDIDKLPKLIRKARQKQKSALDESVAILRLKSEADELDRLHHRLEQEALTDPLTGVYNRRCFEEQVMARFAEVAEFGTVFTLLLIDLDNFKQTNDRYGHVAGDLVLKEIGAVLRASIRSDDMAFRFGGEEFTVLLSAIDLARGRDAAERVRGAIEQRPIVWEGEAITVTASVGFVSHPGSNAQTPSELIKQADQAMYLAKANGKNRVEGFPG